MRSDFEGQLRRAGLSNQQVRALVEQLGVLIAGARAELNLPADGPLPTATDVERARLSVKRRRKQVTETASKLHRLLESLVGMNGSGLVAGPARYRHTRARVQALEDRLKAACAEIDRILTDILRTIKQSPGPRPDPVLRKVNLSVALAVQSVGIEPTAGDGRPFLLALAHVYNTLDVADADPKRNTERDIEKIARRTLAKAHALKFPTKKGSE